MPTKDEIQKELDEAVEELVRIRTELTANANLMSSYSNHAIQLSETLKSADVKETKNNVTVTFAPDKFETFRTLLEVKFPDVGTF